MPRNASKLADSDVEFVFQLRLSGGSLGEIARKFGVSESYISDILHGRRRVAAASASKWRIAFEKKLRKKPMHWAAGAIQAAVDEYMGGLSLRVAAARWCVSTSALWRELVRRRLKRP